MTKKKKVPGCQSPRCGSKPRAKQMSLARLRQEDEQRSRDWLDRASELNEEALACDGFESCIMGVATRYGMDSVLAYDYDKCLALLISRDGMTYEEASEFFEFNVIGAWMGAGTPVFVSTQLP